MYCRHRRNKLGHYFDTYYILSLIIHCVDLLCKPCFTTGYGIIQLCTFIMVIIVISGFLYKFLTGFSLVQFCRGAYRWGHSSKLTMFLVTGSTLFLKGWMVQTFRALNMTALLADYHRFIKYSPAISLLFF